MSTAEQIYDKAKTLPASTQEALLRITELLSEKPASEDREWSDSSLVSAMRGMEDEIWPDLTAAKTFEKWK